MTQGQIILQGFRVETHDAEGNKVVDGKATEEKVPLKVVRICDAHSPLEVHLVFSPEQLEQFAGQLTESRIVRPRDGSTSFFTRNGGIRG